MLFSNIIYRLKHTSTIIDYITLSRDQKRFIESNDLSITHYCSILFFSPRWPSWQIFSILITRLGGSNPCKKTLIFYDIYCVRAEIIFKNKKKIRMIRNVFGRVPEILEHIAFTLNADNTFRQNCVYVAEQ